MATEDGNTLLKLKKNRKELIANILFCGILGSIGGVILGNIVNLYLLSIGGAILIVEGLGLTVNVSLIKEIKHLKVSLKQETIEMKKSVEKEESTKLEEKIQEENQDKKDFILETPISQMTLYGYRGVFYPIYFDLEEKQKFNEESNIPMQFLHSIAFIGDYAGRKNVIRVYDQKNILDIKEYYVAMDGNGYTILNEEKYIPKDSTEGTEFTMMYEELKKRKIVLEEIKPSDEEITLMLSKAPGKSNQKS